MFYLRSHFGAEARYADQTIGIDGAIAVEIVAAAAQRHPLCLGHGVPAGLDLMGLGVAFGIRSPRVIPSLLVRTACSMPLRKPVTTIS